MTEAVRVDNRLIMLENEMRILIKEINDCCGELSSKEVRKMRQLRHLLKDAKREINICSFACQKEQLIKVFEKTISILLDVKETSRLEKLSQTHTHALKVLIFLTNSPNQK